MTAIIRCEVLEKVEQRLNEIGAPGVSVIQVKGHGEYSDFYSRDSMTTHAQVEIFISAQRAEVIVQAIMDAAHSGTAGDGIVAVLPVNQVYRIRHRAAVLPDEL